MAGKLNNTQKASIQAQLAEGKGIQVIAKSLDVPLSAVKSYLITLFESLDRVKEIQKKTAQEAEDLKNVQNLMITKTQNKNSGVAIMTQAASQRVDEANKAEAEKRQTLKGDGGLAFRNRYHDCITKAIPNKD